MPDAAPRRIRRRPRAKKAMLGVKGTAHPRAKFTEAQKMAAVKRAWDGVAHAKIARELGCHRLTVKRWVQEAEALL